MMQRRRDAALASLLPRVSLEQTVLFPSYMHHPHKSCHPRIKLQSRRETGDTGRTNLSCCHLQLCLEYLESSESCFKAGVPAIRSTGGIQGFASGQFRADRRTIQAKTKVIRTGSRRCALARSPSPAAPCIASYRRPCAGYPLAASARILLRTGLLLLKWGSHLPGQGPG